MSNRLETDAQADLADDLAEAVEALRPEGWQAVVVLFRRDVGDLVVRSSANQHETHLALADLLHQITH